MIIQKTAYHLSDLILRALPRHVKGMGFHGKYRMLVIIRIIPFTDVLQIIIVYIFMIISNIYVIYFDKNDSWLV